MQKNLFSYLVGVGGLLLLCSCGTGKKDEVKVDIKNEAPISAEVEKKEVAQNTEETTAPETTTDEQKVENTTVAQATPAPETENQAATENKVA